MARGHGWGRGLRVWVGAQVGWAFVFFYIAMGGGELLLSSLLVLLGGIIRFRKLESINCLINCEDEAIIVKL